MKKLSGKKLLVLGATRDELTLVLRAQELGAYVIVTDIFDSYTSPAKCIADEAWNDSWKDVGLIVSKCKKNKVDGVTAGYSEVKIDYLIQICEKLGLPCYANQEQLEITRDKIKFKNACRACGIPTVQEYASVDEVDSYPVIVKPVDRAGSIGVSVAMTREELDRAYQYAMDTSLTKKVIIEKYMFGTKVDLYYAVEDYEPRVITTCDTVMSENNGFERVIQNAWLYPHREEKKLLKRHDEAFKRMIKELGIQYGCIFFSGFEDENGEYCFFECGFRLEGGMQYEYTWRKGLMNFLDIFIVHALTGKTDLVERGKAIVPELKLCTVNFYAKEGIIQTISGFEQLRNIPECTLSHVSAKIGDVCDGNRAILKKIGMFSITHNEPSELQRLVAEAMGVIEVLDEKGKDLIYDRFDPALISGWWDKGRIS